MHIAMNDNLKEALEMTCKYASEYKVDIDVHFDADGEVSVSVTPTYRDRAEQTEPSITKVGYAIDSVTGEVLGMTLDTDCSWK